MRKKKVKQILKSSYLNLQEAKNKLQGLGYVYDNELSTPESKVFLDKKGRPNIAFRRTKNIKNLGTDLALGLGLEKYDNRFREAKHLTQLVEDKYSRPANAFGSSLGGSLAERSGAHGRIITHNKGVSPFDIAKTIGKNQTDYRNKNDLVSLLALTQPYQFNNLR